MGIPPLTAGAATAAQPAPEAAYQRAVFRFDQRSPNRSSGTRLEIDHLNPTDPSAKPPAVRKFIIEAAHGARWDTSVPARCRASDEELVAAGEAACPDASRVGTGTITVDTGLPGEVRFVTARTTFFNAKGQLISLNTVKRLGLRTVVRARVLGARIVTEVAPLPGSPPEGGAVDTISTRDPRVSLGRGDEQRAYFRTPPRCPRTGRWTNKLTFTYADGTKQTTKSSTPCSPTHRAARTGPHGARASAVAGSRMSPPAPYARR